MIFSRGYFIQYVVSPIYSQSMLCFEFKSSCFFLGIYVCLMGKIISHIIICLSLSFQICTNILLGPARNSEIHFHLGDFRTHLDSSPFSQQKQQPSEPAPSREVIDIVAPPEKHVADFTPPLIGYEKNRLDVPFDICISIPV